MDVLPGPPSVSPRCHLDKAPTRAGAVTCCDVVVVLALSGPVKWSGRKIGQGVLSRTLLRSARGNREDRQQETR